jgi:hypothetical protein
VSRFIYEENTENKSSAAVDGRMGKQQGEEEQVRAFLFCCGVVLRGVAGGINNEAHPPALFPRSPPHDKAPVPWGFLI